MFENTFYIPCVSKKLFGYTQKNLISIFIPTNININEQNCLEHFIIRLSFILNTVIHEQLKHYAKSLIFFNSFRYGEKKHIESDEDLDNEESEYLKGLMAKKGKKNKNLNGKELGHRTEVLLYGEVLEKLTSLQGLKMFYKSTWETSIEEHFSLFKNNYISELKNKPGMYSANSYFDLNEIFGDEDICPFFKKILQKFIEFKNIKSKDLFIDVNYTSLKNPENYIEEQEGNSKIHINLNYEEHFDRDNSRDYNP